MDSETFFGQYELLETADNEIPPFVIVISQQRDERKGRVGNLKGLVTAIACVLHVASIILDFVPLC
jgi:hypothetical protein